MDDVYKNVEKQNQNKKRKILIVFDGMIAGMLNNKKLFPVVTEYILEEESKIFLPFLLQNLVFLWQKTLY